MVDFVVLAASVITAPAFYLAGYVVGRCHRSLQDRAKIEPPKKRRPF